MSRFAKLAGLERRLSDRSDEKLVQEIDALRAELRMFQRAHRLFRERAHAAVDGAVEEAYHLAHRSLAEIAAVQGPPSILGRPGGGEPPALRAALLLTLTRPEFAKAWRAAVDAHDGFSELTVAEYESERSRIMDEIRDHEVELERRRVIVTRDEVESELASLERAL